jgi:ABC-2 type transport system permease protein
LLEAVIATPAPFALVMLARIGTISAFGLVGFAESWLVARIVFGVTVPIPHPEVLLPTLACAAFACTGTALVFSALFSLRESARVFQNSISYPFYLLGGILVPVSYLPWWLQPASRVIFLSWTADLLRDSLQTAPPVAVPQRLAIVLLLGFAGLLVGWFLLHRIVDRLRHDGTIGLA